VSVGVGKFLSCVQSGAPEQFVSCLGELAGSGELADAFRALTPDHQVSLEIQDYLPELWKWEGDSLRSDLREDPQALASGLRVLFPPYVGHDAILYRAEDRMSHEARDYGFSWSSVEGGARAHLKFRRFRRGGVLLRALVPATAIIAQLADEPPEWEYIVDPAGIAHVMELDHFPRRDQLGRFSRTTPPPA
jgi:hypothetical protein